MIIGHMDNLKEDLKYLPTAIQEGLRYLQGLDLFAPAGRYEADGADLFYTICDYMPSPAAKCRAETHVRYIDIQYMVDGAEYVGVAPRRPGCTVEEDCVRDRDAVFYAAPPDESAVLLTAGMYMVFFPTDVHRPGCRGVKDGPVRKVVMKIAIK